MIKWIVALIIIWLVFVGIYQTNKTLPEYTHYESEVYSIESKDVYFFTDKTFVDTEDDRQSEQQIFDEIFRMIDSAKEYVLIDLFFYSDFTGIETSSYRQLSSELTQKMIQKKEENPEIIIQVITDPINVMYDGHISDDFELLRKSGISVLITDVDPLRDSNPIYSTVWRTFFQWFGNSDTEGFLPNPLDAKSPKLGLRTYLKMLNYKANHRKVVLTDYDNDGTLGFSVLITSANPHDGSSAHSNMAVRVDSSIWQDVLTTEAAVANFSNELFEFPPKELIGKIEDVNKGDLDIQLLSEGAIGKRAIQEIDKAKQGDKIDIAMFYISDRGIVKSLKRADTRGVDIRMLLDSNKDAFGREKNGAPNRQVANELMKNSNGATTIRWCDTHGEQCHSKLLFIRSENKVTMMQGSANFTKRNIGDYNLETNIIISGPANNKIFVAINKFFEIQWNNEKDKFYSVPYETYEDTSVYKSVMYRLKEFTGVSRW